MKNIDKRIIAEGFHTGHEVDYVTIPEHDYEYLKQQAERVQELEEDNENLQILSNINRKEHMRIHEQNKRYREAIKNALDEGMLSESAVEVMFKALEESE